MMMAWKRRVFGAAFCAKVASVAAKENVKIGWLKKLPRWAEIKQLWIEANPKHLCVADSKDGRSRSLNNVFVERLWRTVKYEEFCL